MKERPIIFGAADVRATLAGRKTQTRRVVKPQPEERGAISNMAPGFASFDEKTLKTTWCPFGAPGCRLWVRETWGLVRPTDPTDWLRGPIEDRDPRTFWDLAFRADYGLGQMFREPDSDTVFWRPGIHMPRWASRITLEVTGVRVERLCNISEEDAVAEGIACTDGHRWGLAATGREHNAPTHAFRALWESINGPESWAANPWVWVVEFRRVTP